jgi:hypothetical protein
MVACFVLQRDGMCGCEMKWSGEKVCLRVVMVCAVIMYLKGADVVGGTENC